MRASFVSGSEWTVLVSLDQRPQHEPSDERLLAEHLAGEPGRFEQLVSRHSRELFLFLARFAGDATAAEDLVQEAFLQVYLSAEGFDPSRRFRPWLFTIAANKARDRMRYRSRRPEVPLDAAVGGESGEGRRFLDLLADEGGDPSEPVEQAEERRLVRQAVDEMPDHLREVLILGYYHQMPYRDIAEALGIPLGTVKSRLHAAVKQFAAVWRKSMEGQER